MQTITLNHWKCSYSPMTNMFSQVKYPEDPPTFEFCNRWKQKHSEECFGCEQDFITKFTVDYIWTGYLKEGVRYIIPGLHYISSDHTSYFVTKHPIRENMIVKLDKDDDYYYNRPYDQ